MSVDYVWVCDGLKEVVDPAKLPGCTGHQVSAMRQPSAGVLTWLVTRGRWAGKAARVEGDAVVVDISGDGDEKHRAAGYADVTAEVAAEMAENVNADLLAKTTRLNHVGEHATRLQAAIEQNEADAQAMLEALKVATPLLPDDVKATLEARARDILRTDTKALAGESQHRADIMVRAQREDMMRRRIGELVAERDGARAAAHVLAGVETKVALGPEAARAAEAFAASALGLSGAEWAKVLAAPPSDRAKAFAAAGGADAALTESVHVARAEVANLRAALAKERVRSDAATKRGDDLEVYLREARAKAPASKARRGPIEQLASLIATGDAHAPGRTVPSPVHGTSRPKAAKAKPARAKATKRPVKAKKGGKR